MKDHDIREFVNTLRDIAVQFHNHQSLRGRLSGVVHDFLDSHCKNVIMESQNNKEDV